MDNDKHLEETKKKLALLKYEMIDLEQAVILLTGLSLRSKKEIIHQ